MSRIYNTSKRSSRNTDNSSILEIEQGYSNSIGSRSSRDRVVGFTCDEDGDFSVRGPNPPTGNHKQVKIPNLVISDSESSESVEDEGESPFMKGSIFGPQRLSTEVASTVASNVGMKQAVGFKLPSPSIELDGESCVSVEGESPLLRGSMFGTQRLSTEVASTVASNVGMKQAVSFKLPSPSIELDGESCVSVEDEGESPLLRGSMFGTQLLSTEVASTVASNVGMKQAVSFKLPSPSIELDGESCVSVEGESPLLRGSMFGTQRLSTEVASTVASNVGMKQAVSFKLPSPSIELDGESCVSVEDEGESPFMKGSIFGTQRLSTEVASTVASNVGMKQAVGFKLPSPSIELDGESCVSVEGESPLLRGSMFGTQRLSTEVASTVASNVGMKQAVSFKLPSPSIELDGESCVSVEDEGESPFMKGSIFGTQRLSTEVASTVASNVGMKQAVSFKLPSPSIELDGESCVSVEDEGESPLLRGSMFGTQLLSTEVASTVASNVGMKQAVSFKLPSPSIELDGESCVSVEGESPLLRGSMFGTQRLSTEVASTVASNVGMKQAVSFKLPSPSIELDGESCVSVEDEGESPLLRGSMFGTQLLSTEVASTVASDVGMKQAVSFKLPSPSIELDGESCVSVEGESPLLRGSMFGTQLLSTEVASTVASDVGMKQAVSFKLPSPSIELDGESCVSVEGESPLLRGSMFGTQLLSTEVASTVASDVGMKQAVSFKLPSPSIELDGESCVSVEDEGESPLLRGSMFGTQLLSTEVASTVASNMKQAVSFKLPSPSIELDGESCVSVEDEGESPFMKAVSFKLKTPEGEQAKSFKIIAPVPECDNSIAVSAGDGNRLSTANGNKSDSPTETFQCDSRTKKQNIISNLILTPLQSINRTDSFVIGNSPKSALSSCESSSSFEDSGSDSQRQEDYESHKWSYGTLLATENGSVKKRRPKNKRETTWSCLGPLRPSEYGSSVMQSHPSSPLVDNDYLDSLYFSEPMPSQKECQSPQGYSGPSFLFSQPYTESVLDQKASEQGFSKISISLPTDSVPSHKPELSAASGTQKMSSEPSVLSSTFGTQPHSSQKMSSEPSVLSSTFGTHTHLSQRVCSELSVPSLNHESMPSQKGSEQSFPSSKALHCIDSMYRTTESHPLRLNPTPSQKVSEVSFPSARLLGIESIPSQLSFTSTMSRAEAHSGNKINSEQSRISQKSLGSANTDSTPSKKESDPSFGSCKQNRYQGTDVCENTEIDLEDSILTGYPNMATISEFIYSNRSDSLSSHGLEVQRFLSVPGSGDHVMANASQRGSRFYSRFREALPVDLVRKNSVYVETDEFPTEVDLEQPEDGLQRQGTRVYFRRDTESPQQEEDTEFLRLTASRYSRTIPMNKRTNDRILKKKQYRYSMHVDTPRDPIQASGMHTISSSFYPLSIRDNVVTSIDNMKHNSNNNSEGCEPDKQIPLTKSSTELKISSSELFDDDSDSYMKESNNSSECIIEKPQNPVSPTWNSNRCKKLICYHRPAPPSKTKVGLAPRFACNRIREKSYRTHQHYDEPFRINKKKSPGLQWSAYPRHKIINRAILL